MRRARFLPASCLTNFKSCKRRARARSPARSIATAVRPSVRVPSKPLRVPSEKRKAGDGQHKRRAAAAPPAPAPHALNLPSSCSARGVASLRLLPLAVGGRRSVSEGLIFPRVGGRVGTVGPCSFSCSTSFLAAICASSRCRRVRKGKGGM